MIFLLKVLYSIGPKLTKRYLLNKITKLEGGQMFSLFLRDIYKKDHNIIVGYGSYGGCFNKANIFNSVEFGNYCSIAPEIKIFRANHPKETFTTHPLLYNPIVGYVKKDQLFRPKLMVGHDVWIGEKAIILPSVMTIGNGAIIGAGAVVTKNVPPYSIVVGNPSKVIGKRFDNETIKILEESKWWDLNIEDLKNKAGHLNEIINKLKSE